MADRMDIVEGYYWFYNDHYEGMGSHMYRRLCQLQRRFRPPMRSTGPTTPEAQAVYDGLVARYMGSPLESLDEDGQS